MDRTAVATVAKSPESRGSAKAAVPAFTLGPLIRFGIFVVVLYAGSWLLRIPEVILLSERAQAGHFSDEDLQVAKNAVVDRVQSFLRNAQDPNPPRAVESTEKSPAVPARPAESQADAPARSAQPVAVASAPETDSLPPGVSLPGTAEHAARVHQVNPEYTPEALRAKLEGRCCCRPSCEPTASPATFRCCAPSTEDSVSISRPSAALRQWRFAPGQRQGSSCRCWCRSR